MLKAQTWDKILQFLLPFKRTPAKNVSLCGVKFLLHLGNLFNHIHTPGILGSIVGGEVKPVVGVAGIPVGGEREGGFAGAPPAAQMGAHIAGEEVVLTNHGGLVGGTARLGIRSKGAVPRDPDFPCGAIEMAPDVAGWRQPTFGDLNLAVVDRQIGIHAGDGFATHAPTRGSKTDGRIGIPMLHRVEKR